MAKSTKQPEAITIRYDLHDLPTAQHKAGLAGLLLQIESMDERRKRGADLPEPPRIEEFTRSSAEVTFTEQTTLALFDDLYDAEFLEQARPRKDIVQPMGHFLRRYTDDGKELWHKLWRDMLFAVPRSQPASLAPFKHMATLRRERGRHVESVPETRDPPSNLRCPVGKSVWKGLVATAVSTRRNSANVGISGTLFLGAQALNAEGVSFENSVQNALLLHFWPIAARIYVPEVVKDRHAATGDLPWELVFVGFIIAIPAVADLLEFRRRHLDALCFLDARKHRYYPADAVVALPEEAGSSFISNLAATLTTQPKATYPAVSGIELYHYQKPENEKNSKLLSYTAFVPDRHLQRALEGIRRQYQNPVFRQYRATSLLQHQSWFQSFGIPLSELKANVFLCPYFGRSGHRRSIAAHATATFAYDCYRRFRQIRTTLKQLKELGMCEDDSPDFVDDAVFRIVERYIHRKTLKRMNLPLDADRSRWKTPDSTGKLRETAQYQEERTKACEQAFLEFRSRQGDEFARRFAEEMAPAGGGLSSSFRAIAKCLLRKVAPSGHADGPPLRTRDDIRILTLLAISASSRNPVRHQPGTVGNSTDSKRSEI